MNAADTLLRSGSTGGVFSCWSLCQLAKENEGWGYQLYNNPVQDALLIPDG